jgi:beta-N-acetylhexosaminidase
MIAHAAYPQVSKDRNPASLSKVWITDILRKRIRYRNLIVSDDLEMGGVLSAAPVGQAAVEHIRAGGDLCLVCHRADYISQAYDELIKTAEDDPKFARFVADSVRRVLAFKKKSAKILRKTKSPSAATVEKLSRKLWEFGEQVRLEGLVRTENKRAENAQRPGSR